MNKQIVITVGCKDGSDPTSGDLEWALDRIVFGIDPAGGNGTHPDGTWWRWTMTDEPGVEVTP